MASATPPPASTAVPESEGVGLGPDGEKIVDPSYYDLLGIKGNADDAAIKKAYRKMAMKFHPDKNPGDDTAAAKFQEISEAYAILSDSNSRAVYNKQGKKSAMTEAGGEGAMPDPGQVFASLFGGKSFEDWIGEISLGKDVSKAFEMTTTEEEREEMKNELNTSPPAPSAVSSSPAPGAESTPPTYTAPPSTIQHHSFDDVKHPAGPGAASTTTQTDPFVGAPTAGKAGATTSAGTTTATASFASATPATGSAEPALSPAELAAKAHAEKEAKRLEERLQREKMEAYDRERADEKKERVRVLAQKLKDRIRPFVEARNPGGEGDSESKRFEERIREETGDLALESFGVEICHLIGQIYMSKASSYLKLHRKGGNILGIKGFFSRLGETTKTLKEGWSFLSVGLEVSRSMQEFEKRQEKGEVAEEELRKMEEEMSGKMLLVAWKGSKFEVSNVLRQVVDTVLTKDSPEVTDEILMNRAKAIFLTGAILKAVKPSEEDDERRELERMVEEANQKRKEKGKKAKK